MFCRKKHISIYSEGISHKNFINGYNEIIECSNNGLTINDDVCIPALGNVIVAFPENSSDRFDMCYIDPKNYE